MCKYGNQVVVDIPNSIELRYNSPDREIRKTVSVDSCLVDLIQELWSQGIKTTTCCCGHFGKFPSHIGVENQFIDQMRELGYVNDLINSPDRSDLFLLKQ